MQENKPIYIQIADSIMDAILEGTYSDNSRIPSVREVAAKAQINVNTAMRTFEMLDREGIIYNKRGLGYFVAEGAATKIINQRAMQFKSKEMGYFFSRLKQLGITPSELNRLYTDFLDN